MNPRKSCVPSLSFLSFLETFWFICFSFLSFLETFCLQMTSTLAHLKASFFFFRSNTLVQTFSCVQAFWFRTNTFCFERVYSILCFKAKFLFEAALLFKHFLIKTEAKPFFKHCWWIKVWVSSSKLHYCLNIFWSKPHEAKPFFKHCWWIKVWVSKQDFCLDLLVSKQYFEQTFSRKVCDKR